MGPRDSTVATQAARECTNRQPNAKLQWAELKQLYRDAKLGVVSIAEYRRHKRPFLETFPAMFLELELLERPQLRPKYGIRQKKTKKNTVVPPTEEQIAELVALGLNQKTARTIQGKVALGIISNLQHYADRRAISPTSPKPFVRRVESEPREATDGDLLRLKRLGGKYGNHHRRR